MQKEERICRALERAYGKRRFGCGSRIGTLVETILSQNTTDLNSGRAYRGLRKEFPTWERVMDADTRGIARAIRVGGLPAIKARRIKGALKRIKKERGKLDIGFLGEMGDESAMQWLTSIDGIGPKTAAIVLMFCFGKSTMPVDTHVFRVSKRLGIVPPGASRVKAQELLNKSVPDKCKMSCHINLIELGRSLCRPKAPKCVECPLKKMCESAFMP